MEAVGNGMACTTCVRYTECDWGDLIEGTKVQLQALGLGVGLIFPGEPGGPRRSLKVSDPRGFPARISIGCVNDSSYLVRLTFPCWPTCPGTTGAELWAQAFQGVMKHEHMRLDEYVGSAGDLAAAGLVRVDQLPGAPGMRKVRVTIFPDGTVPGGPATANHRETWLPGARRIERASASSYRVAVMVTEEERHRRKAALEVERLAWFQQIRALTRPPRLTALAMPVSSAAGALSRGRLRLVWSAANG